MSFFDEAKNKLEEVIGKVEHTIGGAVGDRAMSFDGESHELHGEAAEEELEGRERAEQAGTTETAEEPSADDPA